MSIQKGDKFIIEIDEIYGQDYENRPMLYRVKGMRTLVLDNKGLKKLQKYNEEYEKAIRQAYYDGMADGKYGLLTDYKTATEYTFSAAKKLGYDEGYKTGWMDACKSHDLLTEQEAKEKFGDEIRSEAWEELRKALLDKTFLKANYGTGNWLHIILDFEPEKIVERWREYHNDKKEQEKPSFRVGDRVKFKNGDMRGIVTFIDGSAVSILQSNGKTIGTSECMIEHIGGNVLDDMNPKICETCKWWQRWHNAGDEFHNCQNPDGEYYNGGSVNKDAFCDCWEAY